MKRLRVLRVVAAATLACAAAPVGGAETANPTGFLYYGYGQGSFGYTGSGYAPAAPGYGVAPGAPGPDAGYGYGYTAPGPAAPGAPAYGDYPGYGYGGGYASGYGGYGCGGRHGRHRGHCCSFGGNCDCCNNVWDTYCGPGCAEGAGCCGAPVKVHRRHRALGCGAGPCVDAACGVAPAGRRHVCHVRRRRACAPMTINYDLGGGSDPRIMYDNGGMGGQPNLANPSGGEAIQPPNPSFEPEDEPKPMPEDDSAP